MRLSHTRKALAISVALILTGLVGQATAATTTAARDSAAPVTSASPGPSTPAPGRPVATKPAPKPTKTKPRTESAPISAVTITKPKGKGKTGPAGSLLVTGTKGVALTFDDGPDPQYTPALLKLLAKEKVKATFCLVGTQARRHPDLVKAIAAGGHSFCNHSWNHDLKLGKRQPKAIRADFERANAAIRAAVPNAKIRYMRAPGGNFTPPMVKVAAEMGMHSIYWKVDPRDWEHLPGQSGAQHRNKIIRIVKGQTRPGAIVLAHDYAQPETIAAFRTLLPYLRKRFQLVALT
ncbi:polysaccharide deacetylase [Actinoplanes utahensis]|uniref:Polysaccharide deacetylase n=1 Tax=Actinoplanes utahensis TaxID=1869 RepID=A0A0A6USE0_ACTUT|nr:polysaccharide deacetylase [Actinoplanes utahensis]